MTSLQQCACRVDGKCVSAVKLAIYDLAKCVWTLLFICLFLGRGIESKMERAKSIQLAFLSEIYFYSYICTFAKHCEM